MRIGLIGLSVFVLPALIAASGLFARTNVRITPTVEASATKALNSQRMPLLAAAVNLDPSPSVGGGGVVVIAGSALLPQTSSSDSVGDLDKHTGSSQISVYIVREGDTLSSIADMFNVSINTIAWGNNIKGRIIKPGQELVILPVTGVQHTVQKGDTLASIAKKYTANATEVAHFNELPLDTSLAVGTTITVPDGEIPAPTSSQRAPSRTGGSTVAGYYGWPLDGGTVTQGVHGYNALDIGARSGNDIYASAGGKVVIARNSGWNGGYGSYVVIQHANGTQTLYAHASKVYVSAGEDVPKGVPIAAVGSTGKSTGPHLHFEVRGASNPFR